MPPFLLPASTVLRRKPDDPLSYQLYDTFEDYLPPDIQNRLLELNQSFPLMGLSEFVSTGEITKGQCVLYTQTCLVGQITNGGLEQFFDNCPGLIWDADKLLREFGSSNLSQAYTLAAQNFIDVIRQHSDFNPEAKGEELKLFWAELERAWRKDDGDRFKPIETACYAKNRDADTSNWFTQLEKRVLDWVLEHPHDFVSAS